MKLNLEKAFTAPFTSMGDTDLKKIYLVAGGISIGGFIVYIVVFFLAYFLIIASAIAASNSDAIGPVMCITMFIFFLICTLLPAILFALPAGYVIETIKLQVHGRTAIMPSWSGNYGRFFWNGIKMNIINFIYYIAAMLIGYIPIIILAIIAGIHPSSLTNEELAGVLGGVGMVISMIWIVIIFLLYFILIPMILVSFAANGSFLAAFNIFHILKKILTNILDYIIAMAISMGIFMVFGIIYLLLSCTVIGILLVPLLFFIVAIIIFNLFAQIYSD